MALATVSPIRPTMFLLNDIQIADALERTHAELTDKYEDGSITPVAFNAGVATLDDLWARFFPNQIPDWHYTEPQEEEDYADIQYAEFEPYLDETEWDMEALWAAWDDGGRLSMLVELIDQWRQTDRDHYFEDLFPMAILIDNHFTDIENRMAEEADRQLERQVAQARYGFWGN